MSNSLLHDFKVLLSSQLNTLGLQLYPQLMRHPLGEIPAGEMEFDEAIDLIDNSLLDRALRHVLAECKLHVISVADTTYVVGHNGTTDELATVMFENNTGLRCDRRLLVHISGPILVGAA